VDVVMTLPSALLALQDNAELKADSIQEYCEMRAAAGSLTHGTSRRPGVPRPDKTRLGRP